MDQATPPTDAGEDQGPEPDTDTMISGGNYVDHMSGTADDDLVYLDAGDDFYDGKQGDADAISMPLMCISIGEKSIPSSSDAFGIGPERVRAAAVG